MNKYKRVKNAIKFTNPDRVPLWAPEDPDSEIDSIFAGRVPIKGTTGGSSIENENGEPLRLMGVDGLAFTDYEARRGVKDEWECIWRSTDDTMGQVVVNPLSDWRNFKNFKFPDPYKKGRFDDAIKKVEMIKNEEYYILACQWSILFERMCWLMGHSNFLVEMMLNRSFVIELAEGVTEYGIGIVKRFAEVGAHGLLIGDDWGTQTGSWIKNETFDDIFKNFYKKIISEAHEKNLDVFFHSCGNMFSLIPDLIDCGIDVFNTWQPQVIGINKLGDSFGGKLCFMCSADIQTTIPYKSTGEVIDETELLIDKLGSFSGGLIGVSYSGSTVNMQNVQAMIDTFRTYGVYK